MLLTHNIQVDETASYVLEAMELILKRTPEQLSPEVSVRIREVNRDFAVEIEGKANETDLRLLADMLKAGRSKL